MVIASCGKPLHRHRSECSRFTPGYLYAALDAEIVFLGFKTVILAAGDTELEFVRKLSCKVPVVKLLSKRIGVNTAARTDRRALTGGNGADSGPQTPGSTPPSARAAFTASISSSLMKGISIL